MMEIANASKEGNSLEGILTLLTIRRDSILKVGVAPMHQVFKNKGELWL